MLRLRCNTLAKHWPSNFAAEPDMQGAACTRLLPKTSTFLAHPKDTEVKSLQSELIPWVHDQIDQIYKAVTGSLRSIPRESQDTLAQANVLRR